jgi:hypothetical protein
MADLRAEAEEKRKRWMAQRQAELDRKQAEQSLGISMPGSGNETAARGAGGSGEGGDGMPRANEVLDRLSEQIASRLQVEVRKENARLMQDGESHRQPHHAARKLGPELVISLTTFLPSGFVKTQARWAPRLKRY